mgnify:CR=1 FL=1
MGRLPGNEAMSPISEVPRPHLIDLLHYPRWANKWAGADSNHRRLSQLIYSQSPLATWVPAHSINDYTTLRIKVKSAEERFRDHPALDTQYGNDP